METDLAPIKVALADLTEPELRSLVEASNDVEQIAPGLLAWLEAACDHELNRRAGLDYDLHRLKPRSRPRRMLSASTR